VTEELESSLGQAKSNLTRIQDFDLDSLVQSKRLGELSFDAALAPAKKLIDLFRLLPIEALSHFPLSELNIATRQADSVFSIFQEILNFDLDVGDNANRRDALIARLEQYYQMVFTQIYPLVAYAAVRTVDFNLVDQQARAALQSVKDQAASVIGELEKQKKDAASILDDVRKTAAEQGVTQQAVYFKDEADKHASEASKWRWWTVTMAIAVGLYGLVALFLHKWNWLAPQNIYESVQFSASKLLIFFVLAYMLFLCARNFMSNKHNEIVNRHRQNALLTYRALVESGSNPEARNVVLSHAASAIYGLHDTGYTKQSETGITNSSVVELIPRAAAQVSNS